MTLQETAKELERRLHLHAPYEGSQLPLSQACWALSQIMRKDAPWGDLLRLIGQSLRSSQPALDPGPASTVLKATAIYQVVHGVNPMPGEILDFLAEGLLQPEHHSPGPQVSISHPHHMYSGVSQSKKVHQSLRFRASFCA